MTFQTDNLRKFFDEIKEITFLKRLFGWASFRKLSYDAYEEYRSLDERIKYLETSLQSIESEKGRLEMDKQVLASKLADTTAALQKVETRIGIAEAEFRKLSADRTELSSKNAKLEQAEQTRQEEYRKNIASVNSLRESLEQDRQRLAEQRLKETAEAFEKLKLTWRNHEEAVRNELLRICQSNQVEYVKEVPFKGKPDNTLFIAGEYVVFDAKSPAGDDLENFPKYIKLQTENVAKYVKQDNVRKDLFLVIPSNTVESIRQYSYRLADYNVYVVTLDALEPVILTLKRIEDYEFAEQMTPEERENICRVIGKFTHTAKRKIMIDYFFSFQFLDIISKTNTSLPDEIRKAVAEFEKSEKLNPPQEKRAKQISMEEILSESERLALEARARIIKGNEENKTDL
jgi:DNA repair exonuclease SbcCD ATPase subunit